MLPASAEYLAKINSPIKKYFSKVVINYTDAFLDPTITGESTDLNYISYPMQMVNGRDIMTHKWFELDGQAKLDGMFHLCPDPTASSFNELGWWSSSIADSTGIINTTAQITFSHRKISGTYIAFDDKLNGYAIDYTLKYYSDTTLVKTITATGESDITKQYTFSQISNINKVVLNVTKWSQPNTVVKVAEFTTQVVETYMDDIVVGWSVIEERETSNDNYIPTGAISSNQANINLINGDGRPFDANNILSRLHGLVKPNAKIDIYLGLELSTGIEYQPMFTGWATEWDVPESSKDATTTARDRLNLLANTKITTDVIKNQTFYQWFETVLNDGGLANTEYNIDSDLTTFTIPIGWFAGETHRKALEILAQGSNSTVFIDRLGVLQVKKIENFNSGSVQTFTRADYTNKDNQPIYSNIVNDITVTTSPLIEISNTVVYETGSNDMENIGASTTKTYTINYSETPVSDITELIVSPLVSGVTVTDFISYSWGATVTVTNTNTTSKDFALKATGSIYEVKGSKSVNRTDQTSIDENGRNASRYPISRFLQSKSLAEDIADNTLSSFKDSQRDLTLEFSHNGNPLIELGDTITVADLYTNKEYKVVSQDMNYNLRHFSMSRRGRV